MKNYSWQVKIDFVAYLKRFIGYLIRYTMSQKNSIYYLEDPFVLEDVTVTVGADIGSAVYPDHGDDADLLMQRAEHGPRRRSRVRGDADLRSQNTQRVRSLQHHE